MHAKIRDAVGPPWQPVMPDPAALLAEMRRLRDPGLFVELTEMDANAFGAPLPTEERLQRQAQAHADRVRVALQSGACRRFTTLGFVDPRSWLLARPNLRDISEALLLVDEDEQPKPAVHAHRDILTS
jgi:GH35 family endo-1,4-beta-xylanase